jgi:hypothetical protein
MKSSASGRGVAHDFNNLLMAVGNLSPQKRKILAAASHEGACGGARRVAHQRAAARQQELKTASVDLGAPLARDLLERSSARIDRAQDA